MDGRGRGRRRHMGTLPVFVFRRFAESGSTYYYRARAKNTAGTSAPSNVVGRFTSTVITRLTS